MNINFDAFLETLPMAVTGMTGIFTVILIIFIVIKIMNKAFK